MPHATVQAMEPSTSPHQGHRCLTVCVSSGQTGGLHHKPECGSMQLLYRCTRLSIGEASYNVNQPRAVGGNVVLTTPISCQNWKQRHATASGSGGVGPLYLPLVNRSHNCCSQPNPWLQAPIQLPEQTKQLFRNPDK